MKKKLLNQLKQTLNLLERQENVMGTAWSRSLNPDSAIYKLNRLWMYFVTSLKRSLPIYQMLITNLYLTRLKWVLNNSVCKLPITKRRMVGQAIS